MHTFQFNKLFFVVSIASLNGINYASTPAVAATNSAAGSASAAVAIDAKKAAEPQQCATPYFYFLNKIKIGAKKVDLLGNKEDQSDKAFGDILNWTARNILKLAHTPAHADILLLNDFYNPDAPLTPEKIKSLKDARLDTACLEPMVLLVKHRESILKLEPSLASSFEIVEPTKEEPSVQPNNLAALGFLALLASQKE